MKRHAFTLIELLVVISIISLLVSILLPALSSARAAAQTVRCSSNQRQINFANIQYADMHKDYLPQWHFIPHYLTYHHNPAQKLADAGLIPLITPSNPYASSNIRFCPTLEVAKPTIQSNVPGEQSLIHYIGSANMTGYNNNGTQTWPYVRLADVHKQSSVYLLTESHYLEAVDKINVTAVNDQYRRWLPGAESSIGAEDFNFAEGTVLRYRHSSDTVNFAFVDGHGKTIGYDHGGSGFGEIHYTDHN